ncbi:hypothetical protein [Actinospica durhamensis]|uniref:hypothetical protein n=1 Tax=Actinospica durhamensis TaxID=1508375 RepID=UPI001FEB99B6|nr:hypothetical protein [Actinospica durhamensis]
MGMGYTSRRSQGMGRSQGVRAELSNWAVSWDSAGELAGIGGCGIICGDECVRVLVGGTG